MEQNEILASARQMIGLYGTSAQAEATLRADKMFSVGDMVGFRKWNRVTDAIREIEQGNHDR